ncbi:MAG TPA: LysR family transcriptional regulator [Lacisediminihabitans sp.]|uniref:LysR family transcriptional regulator n=1 Tax=Lacisediminihabitans sp. TaxID=2787631 RepID=UPI002ED8D4A5
METRQLEYFVTVAEELSFTRAAGRLFAVQSTVSAGIRALEHDLGTTLFERSTKHVALTVAGTAMLPEARRAIEAVDRVRTAAAPTSAGIRGRLRVGIFTNLEFVDLPGIFGEFHDHHPLVDLQLAASPSGSTGLADDVRRGRIDAAFMGLPLQDLAGFRVLSLAESGFSVVMPATHPLASRRTIELSELAHERWIDSPDGFGNRIAVDRAFASARLSRTITTQVADLGEIPRFVAAGLGIAVIPTITYVPADGVVLARLTGHDVDWRLSLISRTSPSPAVSALLDLLEHRFEGTGDSPAPQGGAISGRRARGDGHAASVWPGRR